MAITVQEMLNKINGVYDQLASEYNLIGLRFEDKVRVAGEEITDYSRNNTDRDDEREFPEFGTSEYLELEEMDGISTWLLPSDYADIEQVKVDGVNSWLWSDLEAIAETEFIGKHAYVIVGDKVGREQTNGLVDDGELLIADGKVALVLY